MVIYPYIYFISFLETPVKLVNIPIMMVWYLINPKIFSIKKDSEGRNKPIKGTYFVSYAESEMIHRLMFGDMDYLYYKDHGTDISILNFCIDYMLNLLHLLTFLPVS